MIFSVSSDGIQRTLDFGPASVTIAVNDLVQKITNSSQVIPLAAWQCCCLTGKNSWIIVCHECQSLRTEREQWRSETKYPPVWGAKDLDTSSYQVSHLEDIEFNWENSQLDMDSVFRPGIDTPFSPTVFDDLLMGDGSVQKPIVVDKEQDKENAPPTTAVSERPTEPPRLLRSRAFGARIENVPDYVYRNLFQ